MELNARIAKMIFDKNPERGFYYEERYPLDWSVSLPHAARIADEAESPAADRNAGGRNPER